MLDKPMPIPLLTIIFGLLFISACSVTPQGTLHDAGLKTSAHSNATYINALAAIKNNNSRKAQRLLQEVINQQPLFSNAHLNLGIVYFKNSQLNKSKNSLLNALRINPKNIYALNQLGILYRQQGDFSAAKSSYQKAIEINSDYAFAHLNLGILYDLYFYNFRKAINEYKIYQELTENKNKQVGKWIVDLERRYKKSLAPKSK